MSNNAPQLRAPAIIATVAGGVGSVALMFHAGKHPPRLLLVLFTLWVLSPFVALIVAFIMSKRWSSITRSTLYILMLVGAVVSVVIYADITVVAPMANPTRVFVIIPPASVVLITAVLAVAALIGRRRSSSA